MYWKQQQYCLSDLVQYLRGREGANRRRQPENVSPHPRLAAAGADRKLKISQKKFEALNFYSLLIALS